MAPLPQIFGLVACVALVGCFEDGATEDSAAEATGNDTGGTMQPGQPATSGDAVTTINNDADAGGADYGGPEWDTGDDFPQETGLPPGQTEGTTGGSEGTTGGSSTGPNDTGGGDTTTAGSESGSSEETDAGNVTNGMMTDEGGEDYGGAPPNDPDGEI